MQSRQVEQLLESAARSKANDDYEKLFAGLKGVELFLNLSAVPENDAPLPDQTATPLSTPLVRVGNSLRAIVLFTSKENPKLKKPFGGIRWQQALEMLVKMPAADGMVIEGASDYWVAIDKARAQFILSQVGAQAVLES